MPVEACLKELFYEKDYLIVPGFGGFKCKQVPAQIDIIEQEFVLPFKEITFTKQASRNDGVLIDYLSKRLQISSSDALLLIVNAVKQYKAKLKEEKKLVLEDIGEFSVKDESLVFVQNQAVNYLMYKFGQSFPCTLPQPIEPVPVTQILTKTTEEKISPVKEIASETVPSSSKKEPVKQEINPKENKSAQEDIHTKLARKKFSTRKLFSAGGIFLVILLGAIWFLYNRKSALVRTETPAPIITHSDIGHTKQSKMEEIQSDSINQQVNNVDKSSFVIIVGCFQIKENALRIIQQLNEINIQADIIDKTKSNLYRVGIGNFTMKEDAVHNLSSNRKLDFIKGKWILDRSRK